MTDEKYPVLKESAGDVAHAATKAALSAIPYVGGTAAELFALIVKAPLDKRRDAFMEEVGRDVQRLLATGLSIETLQENEQFISAAMYASEIAVRTHNEAKREALRNAVLNVATGQSRDETLQHMFLNLVDQLTELHLRILKLFQQPPAPPNTGMGALTHVLERNIPELRNQRALTDLLWRDLYARGLVNAELLHVTMTVGGLAERRTTPMGDEFLKFITRPVD